MVMSSMCKNSFLYNFMVLHTDGYAYITWSTKSTPPCTGCICEKCPVGKSAALCLYPVSLCQSCPPWHSNWTKQKHYICLSIWHRSMAIVAALPFLLSSGPSYLYSLENLCDFIRPFHKHLCTFCEVQCTVWGNCTNCPDIQFCPHPITGQ
jgi:hypothetical protein